MSDVEDNMTAVTSATRNSDEELVTELWIDLEEVKRSLSRECCIYRVPSSLRRVNEAAYTPQYVSIGPLHYGDEKLKKMEKHKLRYLERFLKRAKGRANLEDFVGYVKKNEEKVRRCYAETFDDLNSNEFARIILVDASFIIEHILRGFSGGLIDEYEEGHQLIFDIPFLDLAVFMKDMVLLENQLPFFVLEGLYGMGFANPPFSDISHLFFRSFNYQEKPMPKDFKHFTDLVRYYQLPEVKEQPQTPTILTVTSQMKGLGRDINQGSWFSDFPSRLSKFLKRCSSRFWKVLERVLQALLRVGFYLVLLLLCQKPGQAKEIDVCYLLYCATQLDEAGVRFQVGPSKCLFDIKFSDKGELEMPCFTIDDNTEALVRNVMALEQCHYLDKSHVCDYFLLMDSLINTDKDVDLLVQNKILVNQLGSNQEVASLVNKFGLEIVYTPENSRFSETARKLNGYYEEPIHKSKAALRHGYFKTPWRRASTIAAIIILLLTLAQTFSSFLSLAR